jgi:O-acetyl-ADP-ribose deacetylase (regulator of RNase III)
MEYKEVKGDLINLAKDGAFGVIAHGCNCFCTMGAGIAPQMAKAFGCDEFPLEGDNYEGNIEKLGCIDYQTTYVIPKTGELVSFIDAPGDAHVFSVVNCYTQFGLGLNHVTGSRQPLDYEALTLCMRKINGVFKGQRIGLPLIGGGLGGGDPVRIKQIIQEELKDCDTTLVLYNK